MTTSPDRRAARPPVAVLCQLDEPLPDLSAVAERLDLRFTDAGGLADAVTGARGLLLWDFFSSAVREVWPHAGSLEWIHVAAAGVDKLLFAELTGSDVVVTNARGVFDRPIAEFVLASILAQLKQLHLSRDLQRERVWQHRETDTLAGQRVLVLGTGAIGREIARVLRSLGVQVRGAGRTARADDPDFDAVVHSAHLADHVGWAHHLVVVAPLTDQTAGLVDHAVLAAMRPGAHLVNVGRGPIVDEHALLDALESGHLGAASLDVFTTEPLPADSPLWTQPSVVVSPHMSGDVVGWRDALARQFVDNVERWLAGRPLANVVDKRLGFVPASQPGQPAAAGRSS